MVERFMHTMADTLAFMVSDNPGDWHLHLTHVAHSYNGARHSATGASPYLLARGYEPRMALHQLMGQLQWATDDPTSADTRERIATILERQRVAADYANQKHEVRRKQVFADPARAHAFGRQHHFTVGSLAWVYEPPRGTIVSMASAVTQAGVWADSKEAWARKLRDFWAKPRRVLAVAPGLWEGKPISPANIVLGRVGAPGGERVHVSRCKPCREPNEAPPPTLPTGFARYLLTRHQRTTLPRGADQLNGALPVAAPDFLDDSEAVIEPEALVGILRLKEHRVVTLRRGMPAYLEFLVQWRDPALPDSWTREQWLDNDSGAQLIDEYWRQQQHVHGDAVPGRGTTLVDRQLARMQRRLGIFAGIQAGRGGYKLPAHFQILPTCPSRDILYSPAFVGVQMLVVFLIDASTPEEHLRWCHGQVSRPAAPSSDKRAPKRARAGCARVQFDDGAWEIPVLHSPYSWSPAAARDSWFVFGDKATLDRVSA
jgi:hypothetical protein